MKVVRFLSFTFACFLILGACSNGSSDDENPVVYGSIVEQIVAERSKAQSDSSKIPQEHFTNALDYTYHNGTCDGKTFGTYKKNLDYTLTNNTCHAIDGSYIYKHFSTEYQNILKGYMYFKVDDKGDRISFKYYDDEEADEKAPYVYGVCMYNGDAVYDELCMLYPGDTETPKKLYNNIAKDYSGLAQK